MSKTTFISSKPQNWVTPFPTIGEVVRVVANVLETKGDSAKDYDRLARGEIFDYEKVEMLWSGAFDVIPGELVSGNIQKVIYDVRDGLFEEYMRILGEGLSCGYSRENIMDCLSRKIANIICVSMFRILDGRHEILRKLVASDKPVSVAFEYNKEKWEEFRKNPPISKDISGEQIKENVYRWMKGEQTPSMEDLCEVIKMFCDLCDRNECDRNEMKLEQVYSVFFCAKVIDNVARYKRLLGDLRSINNGKIVSKEEFYEPLERTLYFYVGEERMEKLSSSVKDDIGRYLQNVSELRKKRNEWHKDKGSTGKQLEKLEEHTTQLQKVNICWWNTQKLRAYWYVLSGEWNLAKECYEEILDIIFYTGEMKTVELFFDEVLVLAAIREDRPFLKKLKHFGVTFGLFGKPYTNSSNLKYSNANKKSRTEKYVIVEDSEVRAWAGRFYQFFPRDSFFIPESELPKQVEYRSDFGYVGDDMPKVADIKDKNKFISLHHLKYPQLVWFAKEGITEEVEKLLKVGADVDKLSSSSESALLFAIMSMDMTLTLPSGDIKIFEMLSKYPHKKKTLETLTNKKRLSVLGSAVETGNPDIVNKVLEMMKAVDADVDIKYGGDDQTPLYTAICCFKASERHLNPRDDVPPELFEYIRRHNDGRGGITTEETRRKYVEMMNNPRVAQNIKLVGQIHSDLCKEMYTQERLLKIIEALLKAGSKPNKPHDKCDGVLMGYTPLMLAAEFDWVGAFDLLVKYGGDVEEKHEYIHKWTGEHKQADCWQIALNYKANKILDYMVKNCKGNEKILIY
jgi:hypothetical protein